MKITFAIPCNRNIQPQTAQCALKLVAKGEHEFHVLVASEGYTIAENRNYIAVQAVNAGSDYLLMIDDDMTFEVDVLNKLIEVDKPIVGVAYHPRSETGQITKYLDETHAVSLEQSDDPKYKVPFKCYATGTGIILIKCSILLEIPRPWFDFEWFETGQCKTGEDWFFCIKAGKHGFETWCHPTIKVGHLGDVILTI
jgi:hypothetical protein